MFEPYAHPTDETVVTGSLGLGLAVSKRLADAMGCRLSYRRMDGLTLFVVDLPLIESGRPLAPPLVTNALKA
jgi:signal transduction histidine kinase